MNELIYSARGDWDEDGFHLSIVTDEDDYTFVVRSTETARQVLSAVSRLRPWIEEYERERRAYNAATPEEREAVLNHHGPVEADLEDASIEHLREAADLERKRAKEEGR